MPRFIEINDEKQQKQVIDSFLRNRQILKQRQLESKIGKQAAQEEIEEQAAPIVKRLKDADEKRNQQQDQLIRQLEDNQQAIVGSINQFPALLAPQRDAIQQPQQQPYQQQMIADSSLDDINMDILNRYRPKSMSSVMLPQPDTFNRMDKQQLKKLRKTVGSMISTQSRGNSKSNKNGENDALYAEADDYRHRIDFHLGANPTPIKRGKRQPDLVPEDDDDELFGQGIKYYKSPDELIERLKLLCASIEAGNRSKEINNEIVEILDNLLNAKCITKADYKKIYLNYIDDK